MINIVPILKIKFKATYYHIIIWKLDITKFKINLIKKLIVFVIFYFYFKLLLVFKVIYRYLFT